MVLLIQTSGGDYNKIGLRMPLGLLYIGTYLNINNIPIKIIDLRICSDWKKIIRKNILNHDLIGITSTIGTQLKHAIYIAKYIKNLNPQKKIIFGGINSSLMYEQIIRSKYVDIIVHGEGEVAMLALAKKIHLNIIKGISYKEYVNRIPIIHHNKQIRLLSQNKIPVPNYSLLKMNSYSALRIKNTKGYSVQTSRGCNHSCHFCYHSNIVFSHYRFIPKKTVLKNIEILVNKYGAKTIYFIDDNILINKQRFFNLITSIHRDFPFLNISIQGIRIDNILKLNDKDLNIMYDCRVKNLDVGLESFNNSTLKFINKKITTKQIFKFINIIKNYDFIVKFNLLYGLPNQDNKNITNEINIVRELLKINKNFYFLFNIYIPFPGTVMYNEAIKAGLKEPTKLEDWGEFSGTRWMNKYSWFSKKDIELLENYHIIFLFSNINILTKVSNKLLHLLYLLYYPIAKLRFNYSYFDFFIEKYLIKFLDNWSQNRNITSL